MKIRNTPVNNGRFPEGAQVEVVNMPIGALTLIVPSDAVNSRSFGICVPLADSGAGVTLVQTLVTPHIVSNVAGKPALIQQGSITFKVYGTSTLLVRVACAIMDTNSFG